LPDSDDILHNHFNTNDQRSSCTVAGGLVSFGFDGTLARLMLRSLYYK